MENEVVRTVLLKNEDFLQRHLVLSRTVINKLKDNGIITDYTRQKLLYQRSEDQMKTLLFPLKMRGLRSLQKFVDVLRETHHRWIAEALLETDIEGGLRKAIDTKKSLRYLLTQQDNSAKTDSKYRSNERIFDPVSTLTSPPKTRLGLAKHLNRVNPSDGYIHADLERARNQTVKRTEDGYISHRFQRGEGEKGKGPILSHVPEKLRELDKSFESESANNRSFLSVLKQEELAIQSLLRQNQQEQREVEQKEKALSEIQGRMRDIEQQVVNLYRPAQNERDAFDRLSRLRGIPWSTRRRDDHDCDPVGDPEDDHDCDLVGDHDCNPVGDPVDDHDCDPVGDPVDDPVGDPKDDPVDDLVGDPASRKSQEYDDIPLGRNLSHSGVPVFRQIQWGITPIYRPIPKNPRKRDSGVV